MKTVDIIAGMVYNLYDDILTYQGVIPNKIDIIKKLSIKKLKSIVKKIDFTNIDYFNCFKRLSNIPVEINDDNEGIIPKKWASLKCMK